MKRLPPVNNGSAGEKSARPKITSEVNDITAAHRDADHS